MLQYDKSAGVVHVDWFHPWKPNRFSSLWIWLSLTSQRFHMRMHWRHFIHHSKAIRWVINPLAYLAAGDSPAERRSWLGHKHQNVHGNARPQTLARPFCRDVHFFQRGRHGDPWADRSLKKKKKASVIQPEPKTRSLTRAASRDRKIFLSASRKKKEEGEKDRIQLHSGKPLLALWEWYQHHLKVWLLTKPITFWLLGNGPVD